nr:Mur ligase family protein [Bacteroides gallinarum]
MSYTIESIAQIIGARRIGDTPATIDWLLTDSRSLSFPEETLFFALPAKRNNGARYIRDLYARGVRNFVVSEEGLKEVEGGEWKAESSAQHEVMHPAVAQPVSGSPLSTLNLLVVPSPLKALQKLAEQHRDRFQIPVIGITGSNGKTIVKEWLHQLLSPERVITRSPRSYNSQIGVPLSVWQMNEQTELAILEAGISEPGEMRALQNIIKLQSAS